MKIKTLFNCSQVKIEMRYSLLGSTLYSYYYPPLLKRLICIMDLYSWNSINYSPFTKISTGLDTQNPGVRVASQAG